MRTSTTNWIDLRIEEWNKKYERKWPVIIAMQGDPYSGKTNISNFLVEWLKYPIIRLEEILEILSPSSETPPTPQKAETLISLAFDIITQTVKTHTSFGFSVIVDSPLSRRFHLDKLVGLLNSSGDVNGVSLLILECSRKAKYIHQMRYKPQDWPPDPIFVGRNYTDDDIHPRVSKIAVDTSTPLSFPQLVAMIHDLTASNKGHKVKFNDWQPIHSNNPHLIPPFSSFANKYEFPFPSPHIHSITVYKQEGIDYNALCGVCENQMNNNNNRGAYTCKYCPLAIHQSCAELECNEENHFTPKTFPKFFVEEHLCVCCRNEGKGFSYECPSCIFECHMKRKLFCTIKGTNTGYH